MIRILDEALVNQIAAGEVVERPASVVKELVENALDAGAQHITVHLREGGRGQIRVVDDGHGMTREDALMSLERHATSKIRNGEDLIHVATLGFRGEAVPSIAAVSRFTLTTRTAGDDIGTRIRVEAGRLRDVADVGCRAGTEIEVGALFYSLPVRRKFLRTAPTELAHCLEMVTREALIRPDVDFRVRQDGREILVAPKAQERAARAGHLLGAQGRSLVSVGFESRGIEVNALVSPIGVHKSSARGAMYLYVNGRFVRDPVVRRGVNEAYRSLIPQGRYPLAVVTLRLAAERVDVNVHPSKIEVRFREPREVVAVLADGLRAGLEERGLRRPPTDRSVGPPSGHPVLDPSWLPIDREPKQQALLPTAPTLLADRWGPDREAPATQPPDPHASPERQLDPTAVRQRPDVEIAGDGPPPPQPAPVPQEHTEPGAVKVEGLLPVPRFRDLRVIGQHRQRYVICEGGGELVLIDQRAAHESVMLHRLLGDWRKQLGQAQRLLAPVVIELPRASAEILAEHLEALDSIWLEIERFGPSTFAIKAAPAALDELDLEAMVIDIANRLREGRQHTAAERAEQCLATMARHSSAHADEELSDYEMRALLAALDEVDGVGQDGRLAVRVGHHALERRFRRT